MNRALQIVIMVCACITAFSVFYYFVIFLPADRKQERAERSAREAAMEQEAAKRQAAYDDCIEHVQSLYYADWNDNCRRLGKKDDCPLPFKTGERIDIRLSRKKEECFREHLGNTNVPAAQRTGNRSQ